MQTRTVAILILLASGIVISACGGGGGGANPMVNVTPPPAPSPPPPPPPPPPPQGAASPLVYGAIPDSGGVFNLYLADTDNPGTAVQLNPTLPAGASIHFFDPTPDGSRVLYAADPNGKVELFAVELTNPGVAMQLSSSSLPINADVEGFVVSPDSTQVIYRADQDVIGKVELYLTSFANPGTSVKVNETLPATADITPGAIFSPDGSKLLYAADKDFDGSFELFLVDIGMPGVATKVNPAFSAFSNLRVGRAFSPDGDWILYAADQDIDGVFELYIVSVSNPGTSVKVHEAYSGDQDVCSWKFSPDSSKIVYCADQDAAGLIELYFVDMSNPGVSIKLNPALISGGEVRSGAFQVSGDSSFVAYVADQDVDNLRELYRVEFAAPTVTQKLNDVLIPAGDVRDDFEIRADDFAIAYKADQNVDAEVELFEVNFSDPGMSTRVHPALAGDDIERFEYSADGLSLVYIGEEDTNEVDELYRVDVASLGVSIKISAPLSAGGQVGNIIIVP